MISSQETIVLSYSRYQAYGLAISSEIIIDALEPVSGADNAELAIEFGDDVRKSGLFASFERNQPIGRRPNPNSSMRCWRSVDFGSFHLQYADGTWFHLDRATWRVITGWPLKYTAADMATYLLGPVMGLVLQLKGTVCLHASAAYLENRAIAFVGNAGAGKSTLAATLALRGAPILSDDIVALDEDDSGVQVRSGYPRLRLWPESVATLLGDPDRLPHISPSWDKRHLDLTIEGRVFRDHPAPLGAIYLLDERVDDDTARGFERLAPADALMAMIAHGYVSYLLDRAMQAHAFKVLSRVAARIPVWRVHPPTDIRHLPGFCDRILEHLATHA